MSTFFNRNNFTFGRHLLCMLWSLVNWANRSAKIRKWASAEDWSKIREQSRTQWRFIQGRKSHFLCTQTRSGYSFTKVGYNIKISSWKMLKSLFQNYVSGSSRCSTPDFARAVPQFCKSMIYVTIFFKVRHRASALKLYINLIFICKRDLPKGPWQA